MDKDQIENNSYDHIPLPSELLESYRRSEENDPRSVFYNRVLIRPKIPVVKLLLGLLAGIAAFGIGFAGVYRLTERIPWALLGGLGLQLLLGAVFVKRILILMVKLYQAMAPAALRRRCRYEPSCSEYMILAIEKHGAWKGLKKGLSRWGGCKPPNGGIDFP